MSNHEVKEIEMNIKQAREIVDLNKSLERLEKNKDFKKLIQGEYLHNEAVRLVHLKSDSNMQHADKQRDVTRDIDAIGSFAQFLNMIGFKAQMAQDAINECEMSLDELRAEGADE